MQLPTKYVCLRQKNDPFPFYEFSIGTESQLIAVIRYVNGWSNVIKINSNKKKVKY